MSDHAQFRHAEQGRITKRQHHAEPGKGEQQSEEAREPSGAKTALLDRRLEIALQRLEPTGHVCLLFQSASMLSLHLVARR